MDLIRRFLRNASEFRDDALIDPNKIVIDQEGLDEDILNDALFWACCRGYTDWIYMLLYYGADPNVAKCGWLPVSMCMIQHNELVRDILTPYSIDNRSLSVQTLVAAMREESCWFCKVLESVSEVVYDGEDEEVYDTMEDAIPSNVKLFMEKFPHVFQHISEYLVERGFLHFLVKRMRYPFYDEDVVRHKDIIEIFLYNSCISKLAIYEQERSICSVQKKSTITMYVESLSCTNYFSEEEITERVLLMLTYGLRVTFLDLEVVYTCYGYCDLFEILLHMDLEDNYTKRAPLIKLYLDPTLTIQSCFDDPLSLLLLLDLYNDTKLKKRCLALSKNYRHIRFRDWFILRKKLPNDVDWYVLNILHGETFLSRLRNMPLVSSLVELSRNVARRYIVDKFKIRTSKELYTVLNGLPIDNLTKDTIKLRRKLY